MQDHLTTTNEDDSKQAVLGFREFDDEELSQLEKKGISPHHLARFLEALRLNREAFLQQLSRKGPDPDQRRPGYPCDPGLEGCLFEEWLGLTIWRGTGKEDDEHPGKVKVAVHLADAEGVPDHGGGLDESSAEFGHHLRRGA